MFHKRPSSPADYFKGALLINAMFIGMGILASYRYSSYSSHLLKLIEQQQPLLVIQLYQSSLSFTWIPIIPLLIIVNIEIFVAKILKKSVPKILKRVQTVSMWVMFLGAGLIAFGNQLVNPIWAKTFTEAGYSRCDTWIIPGSKAFFNDAWVLQPADCHDPVLRQVLHGEWDDIRIDDGRRYLEQKHRFLESHNASQVSN